MSKKILFLGRTASGKTTTVNELVDMGYADILVSYTTRAIRELEEEGVDYNFVSPEKFDSIEMAASFTVNDNWKYGVSQEELDKDNDSIFSVISTSYAVDLAKKVKSSEVIFVFFDLSQEERMKRLFERGESKESVLKRIEIEETEGDINIEEFSQWETIIMNDPSMSPRELAEVLIKKLNLQKKV